MNKKNIIITIISVLILTCIFAYARTTTTDLGLVKPTWTEAIDILSDLNANSDILEAFANDPLEYDSDLERLEDRVGAMWTGNTETGLTVTYQDADNTIDVVIGADDIVESMLKAVNAPLDEEVFTYESTTGDFEWHTLAELSIQPLDAGLTSIAGLTTAANDMIYTTALDTYAIMDTFAELQAVVADKTLVNEEDIFTIDANWINTANPWADNEVADDITIDLATLATTFTCIDNESEALACPIVFVDGATGAQGAETDDTDFTYNPSTGTLKVTALDLTTALPDAEVANNITIDLATLATTITVTDNESTAENNPICFVAGADPDGGSLGIETDGDLHYNPSTGTVTATEFVGGGSGLTGAGYTNLTSFVAQTAWRVFYSNTDGDVTELALGADGTYLKSTGAASAPIFSTPAGAGDVSGPATNIDEGIARWNGVDSKALQDSVLTISDTGTLGSLSNADITIQPNGTGDTRIYAPADVVTTKTGTATLTIAEAGTVLVSAASAYTLTLPTAVGHSGLRYHFIKTDYNYNLITLDGDGTETFNYENSTDAPVQTYPRLNTPLAQVTIASNGSNWQVRGEGLGQVPFSWVYTNAIQLDLTASTFIRVDLNTVYQEIGSNFDNSTWVSGNATSTSAGHLVDSGGAFTAAMVGKRIKNTTDTTYTYVTVYNSATDLTVRDDIFVDTEGYEIKHAKIVIPISGSYFINYCLFYQDIGTVADTRYIGLIYVNDSGVMQDDNYPNTNDAYCPTKRAFRMDLDKDDVVEMFAYNLSGANASDVYGDATNGHRNTFLQINLISKD